MKRTTNIEWTQHTWNPFVGCSLESAGCLNCYAMRMAARIGHKAYEGTTTQNHGRPVWSGKINRASDVQMQKPYTIKAPSRIFVNSMSDFFHPEALDKWRLEALAIMYLTPRHQYQVLTKRPQEIAPFLNRTNTVLPGNFWCGATVERRDTVGRIDHIRAVDATIRFLSIEPLLGRLGDIDLTGIHWVIGGGESGPRSRPMAIDWIREVRDSCIKQGVAFFFKQWGIGSNNPLFKLDRPNEIKKVDPHGKGGGILDGRLWREYPSIG